MVATQTVAQGPPVRNSSPETGASEQSINVAYDPITPRNGVVTLYGYGIGVRVDRGHLLMMASVMSGGEAGSPV